MGGKRRILIKRLALVAVLVALVAAFKLLGLGQYFTLEYLKDSRAVFLEYYTANSAFVLALFMGIYIISTALSLPGATVLTIAGGALFGLEVGVVAVSFASSIGATLAFLVSRFLLRDWVEGRFGGRLDAINRGVEAEGAFYLFTLRLIPVFPFFVINLVMGLTKMRAWTFYWVSQAGMLAATIVFVNAGKEMGKLTSLKGIVSPGLLASFIILGLFPITARKLIAALRRKKGFARTEDLGNTKK